MDHFYEDTDKTPEQIQKTLQARSEAPPLPMRLATNDSKIIRLEVTGPALSDWSDTDRKNLLAVLKDGLNKTVRTVHLSGAGLEDIYSEKELDQLLHGLCTLPSLEELFIFRGNNESLTQKILASHLVKAKGLKVLMMWGYRVYEPLFCSAVQRLENLERNTLTLPGRMSWASMDVYCMGLAQHMKLKCLSLRCSNHCEDAIISPEALVVLMQSKSIESLYLDNCGLTDDHTDVLAAELKENKFLRLLDIKNNYFSDDALYSMASMFPHNSCLSSLDMSGVTISDSAGHRLAKSMEQNRTLMYLELEGDAERYRDEFCIPEGSENKDWFKALDFRLRLNRAGFKEEMPRDKFVESLNSVSDHLGCLFHIVRRLPNHVSDASYENRTSVAPLLVV